MSNCMQIVSYTISNSVSHKCQPKISNLELRRYINAGMCYEDIAKISPMSRDTYCKLLKRFGFQPDSQRLRARKMQMVVDMYNSGASVEEIAKARNVAVSTCKHILADLRELNLIK